MIVAVSVAVLVALVWVPYSRYAARHRRALGSGVGDRIHDRYRPATRRDTTRRR